MSKKSKGVVLGEDAKARLKHQILLQDYEELQKEADVMRSRLEEAKHRKMILAAEVGFLRRRYKYLVRTKTTNSSSQEQTLVQTPNMLKQPKIGKETSKRGFAEPNSKKKHGKQVAQKRYGGKESKGHPPLSDLNPKGILHTRKESLHPNTTPVLDRNEKESMLVANDSNLRNSAVTFDLNQDSTTNRQEASLPTRAPIFDLNEISTWDEDYVDSIKYEEATKSLIKSVNISEEDLKLSICRNAGESSSRSGKRKISWQDPVALRV